MSSSRDSSSVSFFLSWSRSNRSSNLSLAGKTVRRLFFLKGNEQYEKINSLLYYPFYSKMNCYDLRTKEVKMTCYVNIYKMVILVIKRVIIYHSFACSELSSAGRFNVNLLLAIAWIPVGFRLSFRLDPLS